MLLARTCFISGHFQKADLHYNNALKYFPNNEVILYELAMLNKNTNQLMSAISILDKIYKINRTIFFETMTFSFYSSCPPSKKFDKPRKAE